MPWELSYALDKGANYAPDERLTRDGKPVAKEWMAAAFGTTMLHRFDTLRIAAGAAPEISRSPVGEDGGNTAAVLSSLKLLDEDRFENVQAALKRIVPSVERIGIRRAAASAPFSVSERIHFDLRGAPNLPASVVSEGTLVTVALLTSICATSGRRLVLLDDIDRALHPTAQLELVR